MSSPGPVACAERPVVSTSFALLQSTQHWERSSVAWAAAEQRGRDRTWRWRADARAAVARLCPQLCPQGLPVVCPGGQGFGMASALDPPPTGPTIGRVPIAGLVRQARRIAGLGQRQMARFAKVAPSTVGRVEAGGMTVSVAPEADPRPGARRVVGGHLRPGPAARDLPPLPDRPGGAPPAQPVGGAGGEVPRRAGPGGPAAVDVLKRPVVQPVSWTTGRLGVHCQSSLVMVPTATGSASWSPGTPATKSFSCSSASAFRSPRTVTGKAIDVCPAASVRQPTYGS